MSKTDTAKCLQPKQQCEPHIARTKCKYCHKLFSFIQTTARRTTCDNCKAEQDRTRSRLSKQRKRSIRVYSHCFWCFIGKHDLCNGEAGDSVYDYCRCNC